MKKCFYAAAAALAVVLLYGLGRMAFSKAWKGSLRRQRSVLLLLDVVEVQCAAGLCAAAVLS
jgi:hypothetical protein